MQFRKQFHCDSLESDENGKARARVIKVGKKTKPDQVFKENFITKLNSLEGRLQLTSRETLLSAALSQLERIVQPSLYHALTE